MNMPRQSPSAAPHLIRTTNGTAPPARKAGPPSAHTGGRQAGAEQRADRRHETPEGARERVNRRWNEVLQETRVAQTGVQVLFGFLLSVAFTERFEDLAGFDRAVYVVTVILGSAAIGTLIAPVSLHRFLSGQRMKDEVVETAGRLMMCGMVLLALTIGSTLLLLLHVVLTSLLAEILVGTVMVWFAVCWWVLPVWLRSRAARRTGIG
ncbi:DUF6328 family protein [Streptomyces albus subsp. chlorinus]|uniref:DUF6328 family protein n=1 Tax=Streptomyces albus TaxID=1888 RepID=UPI001FABFF00|nr:DUF6328 family protein [Streptomyces albus]